MEVLFKGPLNAVAEGVKCNYIIYWSGDHGMDLVDKWTTEGKIHDRNKETQDTYWTQFENYIHPHNKPVDCSSGTQVTIPRIFKFRGHSH